MPRMPLSSIASATTREKRLAISGMLALVEKPDEAVADHVGRRAMTTVVFTIGHVVALLLQLRQVLAPGQLDWKRGVPAAGSARSARRRPARSRG